MPEQDDTQPRAPYHERRAAILADTSTSSARLRAAILAQFEEFERERRTEILAAGGNPDDRDPFEAVRAIADNWADTAEDPDRRTALLDDLAANLRLREIRALRLAAEAAAAVTPRMIVEEADAGVRPAAIADKLGVTESYVYRVLREQRDAQE
ncbi:hypothetical protein [Streptomyces mexicanus]|uniref:hypothetical protein n=1 Tax=Streptomyces mexicanus TaxID=178566 RepID=UPI003651ACB6